MNSPFTLLYAGNKLSVKPVKAGGTYVFVIRFKDDAAQPLTITRASGMDKPKFWTSIPEGRQKEAEAIGPLVTQHYQRLQAAEVNPS